MKAKVKNDLTGLRFGKLTVIEQAPDHIAASGRRKTMWECRCECGNTITCATYSLTSGHTRSCGCIKDDPEYRRALSERNTKHGDAKTQSRERLYRVWSAMKRRCDCESDSRYDSYGGRGIKVCETWENEYEAFRDWALANGYDRDAPYGVYTLDRIDVDGDYCPENCRWVDLKTQSSNKRSSHLVTYNGKTQTASQWADEYGMKRATLLFRLNSGKGTIEEAITKPANSSNRRKYYTINGITKSQSEWGRDSGIGMKNLWYRINQGWSIEDAITKPLRKWPERKKAQNDADAAATS